jgi:GNAT superfamily N-acetyltransferase
MRIEPVTVGDYLPQITALARENWAETGFAFPLRLSGQTYRSAEDADILIALGAFDDEGEVVGYSTAFLVPHHFNTDVVMCSSDALFVARRLRGTSIGARLIARTEQAAKARGATLMCWHTRAGTPLAEMLLARPGYTAADVVVTKDL